MINLDSLKSNQTHCWLINGGNFTGNYSNLNKQLTSAYSLISDFISFTNAGVSETNATRGVPFIPQICKALLIQRMAAFLARTGLK